MTETTEPAPGYTSRVQPLETMYHSTVDTLDIVEKCLPPDEMIILKSFFRNAISQFKGELQKEREGKPVIGTHFGFPNELLRGFDAVMLPFEALPYYPSALLNNGAEKYYDAMNAWGHPYHTCTAQKGVLGMVLEGALDLDVVICPAGPCDNGIASYQYYSAAKDIPLVVADFPTSRFDDRGYQYYAEELERVVGEVAEILGQEPDTTRIRDAVKYSSVALEYKTKINEFRTMVPNPVESMANPLINAAHAFLVGTPEIEAFFKETYEGIRRRVKNHVPRFGVEERFRSVWPYMSFFFDFSFYEWMDRQLGMSQLVDIFNLSFFDPSYATTMPGIYRDLAEQYMNYYMVRQSQSFVDTMLDDFLWAAKKFKADSVILTAHLGCKQLVSAIQIMREAFRDELGIPMLALEIDVGDKRFMSLGAIKHEISEFTKTLLT